MGIFADKPEGRNVPSIFDNGNVPDAFLFTSKEWLSETSVKINKKRPGSYAKIFREELAEIGKSLDDIREDSFVVNIKDFAMAMAALECLRAGLLMEAGIIFADMDTAPRDRYAYLLNR